MLSELGRELQAAVGERYHVEHEIAGGGMGRLFVATELSLGRRVVLKVLPLGQVSDVDTERFRREISVTAGLRHPYIVPVFGAGAIGRLLYYAMPMLAGETLRQRQRRCGRLSVHAAVSILRDMAGALGYAHEQGVVHRDIKPENILLEGEHAVLLDFGVARALHAARTGDAQLTGVGMLVGTRGYLSPEQATGDVVDGRSDLYALALVGYEMLTGSLPAEHVTAGAVRSPVRTGVPPPVRRRRPEAPAAVSAAIGRALEPDPARRFQTAAEFAQALEGPAAGARQWRLVLRSAAVAAVIGAALVAGWLGWRLTGGRALDDDLVAIAPFDVYAPALTIWRQGYVDLLSANLDGAGPIRAVAPSISIRRWAGPADRNSAVALGRRTGARLVVVGRVLAVGSDSAIVNATLVDARTGNALMDASRGDETSRMERVADSLTLDVLRELGRTRPIGAVRLAAVGSASLPAIKEFLQGEQFLRRTAWDSALAHYDRALAIDSGFALALRHMGLAYAWGRVGMDSVARSYAIRAAAVNRGIAQRESLLIVADSLRSALYAYAGDAASWRNSRRLFETLARATRLYPADPEVWYTLADSRFHFAVGPRLAVPESEILRTFDRAIALDSAFAPAYIHAIELAYASADARGGARYVRAYFALRPTDVTAAGTALAASLLGTRLQVPVDTARLLGTASSDLLFQAYSAARRSLDSAEVAIRMLRLMEAGRSASFPLVADPQFAPRRLVLALGYRGHLREAAALFEARQAGAYGLLALLGAVPADTAALVFASWLNDDLRDVPFGERVVISALPWWLARADTTSILRLQRRADSVARSGRRGDLPPARYEQSVAGAYLALARGDTAVALRRFAALPDTLCPYCVVPSLTYGQLLASQGMDGTAERVLRARLSILPSAGDVVRAAELAPVEERLGHAQHAADAAGLVVRAWSHADSGVRPLVASAAALLARNAGAGRRTLRGKS